jgi:O-antigen ligase
MSSRTQIHETTHKMIDDYGVFGSGPGSFEAVAQFELGERFTTWTSWVHNDYLEFYLTFGKLGGTILIALIVIFTLQCIATLLEGSARYLKWFAVLAIAGVSTHAILDFPLQVYSILSLFSLITAVILTYQAHPHTCRLSRE